MKTKTNVSLVIVLMTSVLLSCKSKNYENTTEVFKDGSCNRTMALKGDSTILTEQIFPVLIDSSWKKSHEIVDKQEFPIGVKVSKHFENVEDMNLLAKNDSSNWSKLNHSFKFDKKFRWFYTYLTYSETYKKENPFNNIPVTDYISRDELAVLNDESTEYLAGRDSAEVVKIKDEIMEKTLKWLQASAFKEFFQTLESNAKVLNNPEINTETIKNRKDSIIRYINSKEKKVWDVLFNVDTMLNYCSVCFNSANFDKLKPANSHVFKSYIEKGNRLDLLFNLMVDNETNSVIMPGFLINTNCKTVIGNKIQWEFSIIKCFFKDYTIQVTSRISNIWAFVVSGGFLVLLIAGLVAGALFKRK